MDNLFYVIFFALALYIGYQIISKRGLKGAVLGSKIVRTVGEVNIDQKGVMNQVVRVHVLENGRIGIELTSKAPLSISMTGFTLSPQQSQQLISHLEQTK